MTETSTPLLVHPPTTANINDLLSWRAAAEPDAVLAQVRDEPDAPWRPVTVAEFEAHVVAVAKGLVARGLQPGDRVGVMSRTRYEWTVLDFAIWRAAGVPVPIYETASAEQVEWILADSEVSLLLTETTEHATLVERVRPLTLDHVLVIDEGALDTLVDEGEGRVPDTEIAWRTSLARATTLATVVYTSGTTGRPKGAELTHGNVVSLALNTIEAMPEVFSRGARTLLFLPLAHVFARFVQVVAVAGGVVLGHTPDPGTLARDLAELRPTFLPAVPRVLEKVHASAEQKAAAGGRLGLFHWAERVAVAYSRALDTPAGPPLALRLQHQAADRLVLRHLRDGLGGHVQYAIAGGGPLGDRLSHLYRGLGLQVLEGYGLTETTATSVNLPGRAKLGSVGPQLPGNAVRIAADGEVQLAGHHVFRGYRNDPLATAEAFDGEWFRTGDLGTLDEDGFLTIIGRKDEVLVTTDGTHVVPAVLEDRVRSHPLVSQCVVVGDGRPDVTALVTLDPDGLAGWLKVHRRPAADLAEAATRADVRAALEAVIERANRAVAPAASIRRFRVLPRDLTVADGHLTPRDSVRRAAVVADFAEEIDALYGHGRDGRTATRREESLAGV